ncbi:MAG: hypothetical protein LBD77_00150 [Bifidobacteriaceae bacterium]|nr:hypothetical protein [Bifidobacteriaceae bacterium]
MLKLSTTDEFAALVSAVSSAHSRAAEAEFAARSAWWQQAEASVAACMKRQGFAYTPTAYRLVLTSTAVDWWQNIDAIAVPTLPATRLDVERFGYGAQEPMSMSPILPASVEEQANTAFFEGLSADAQAAYELALTGHSGADAANWAESGGCRGEAEANHPQPTSFSTAQDVLDTHDDLVHSLRWLIIDGVALDQRMTAVNRDWERCMVEAGVEHLGDVGDDQVTPYAALMVAIRTDPGGVYWDAAGWPVDVEEPEEYRSLVMSEPEIRVALADFDCRRAVGYEDLANQIALELQHAFVGEHRAKLAELLAALDAVSG